MKLQTERPSYDFKIELSPQPERISKEICALANLDKGGYLLVGFDNKGDIVGILRDTIDAVQQRISQIAHNNVNPNPEIEFQVFDHPNEEDRCVLVVQVIAVKRKPCIANERVYIRTGNEAVAAKPDEIRKMVLGSGA
jgi:predicted HTH transcriptional regulator